MPRLLPLLLVTLVILVGVWMLWPGHAGDPEPAPVATTPPTPDDTPPALLTGRPGAAETPGGAATAAPGVEGRVHEAGVGRAAEVEVFRVAEVDPGRPDRAWVDDRRSSLRTMLAFQLGAPPGEATWAGASDAEGHFLVPGLAPGVYVAWARAPDGRSAFAPFVVPAAGARVAVEMALPVGDETLDLRILDADGAAWSGPFVLAGGEGLGDRGPQARGRTDERGDATVRGLTPGNVRLLVVDEDVTTVSEEIEVPHEGRWTWTLPAATVEVHGTVADDTGAPIGGAEVSVMGGDPRAQMGVVTVTTDASGAFTLRATEPVAMWRATAPGHAGAQGRMAASGEPLEVVLARLAAVSGRVIAQDGGAVVAGVRVLAIPIERGQARGVTAVAVSAADGTWRLTGIAPGAAMVFALGSGWASAGLADAKVDGFNPLLLDVPSIGLEDVTLEVVPAGRVEGRVRDAAGTAVAGALVTPAAAGFVPWSGRGWTSGMEGVAVTGADGRYVLDALLPGVTYTVSASASGVQTPPSASFRADAQTPATADLVLPASREVVILLVDATTGDPVAGADVRAWPENQGAGGRWQQTSGGDGRVRLGPVPPVDLHVEVRPLEHVAPQTPVVVAADVETSEDAPLRIELELGVAIEGRVLDEDGAPALRASVRAERLDGGGGWGPGVPVHGPDARFRIAGLRPGRHRVTATDHGPSGRVSAAQEVDAPAEGVELRLGADEPPSPFGGRDDRQPVEVVVRDPKDRPVPSGEITVAHDGGTSGTNIRDGVASVRLPATGDVQVDVREVPPGYGGGGLYGPFPVRGGRIEVRLDEAAPTTGRVVDPQGRGVKGVRISIVPARFDGGARRAPRFDRPTEVVHSGDDGTFDLRSTRAGAYHLQVQVPPAFVTPEPRIVEVGAAPLLVELRTGLTVAVTVLDARGRPVVDATVSATPKLEDPPMGIREDVLRAHTDAQGVARLAGLDVGGRYDLSVSTDANRHPDVIGRVVPDWAPADQTITLERAYVTSGIVLDADGQPVAGGIVWWREPGASGASGTMTDAQGRFRIGPHRGETIELLALPEADRPGLDARADGWERVDSGQDELRLRLGGRSR